MENVKGSSNIRNTIYNGKHPLLPPKSPFPSISSSYADYVHSPAIGPKSISKPREVNTHHQRTSSESLLMEEQPLWLDELLNEPETPVRKGGHRRSSSDSFAYTEIPNACLPRNEYRCNNMISVPSWGSQDFELFKDVQHASFPNSLRKPKNRAWDPSLVSVAHPSILPSARDNVIIQSSGSSCVPRGVDGVLSIATEKQDPVESGSLDLKAAPERKDSFHAKPSATETDTKRAKQQFAQRSRVRKLQYIAELERNVQALQAEGSEFSAELEFLNQQTLILSMENKALKQRLESLSQEQLIKYMEHEVLEREVGRLRALYQQQQHPPSQQQHHPSSSHRRTNSKDLDSQHRRTNSRDHDSQHRRTNSRDLDLQFANLSLKPKDASSGQDPVSGSLHI